MQAHSIVQMNSRHGDYSAHMNSVDGHVPIRLQLQQHCKQCIVFNCCNHWPTVKGASGPHDNRVPTGRTFTRAQFAQRKLCLLECGEYNN